MVSPNKDILTILEAYAAATPHGNDSHVLREWMERYPDHADDLLEFAASRETLKYPSEEGFESDEEKERFFLLSRETFRKFIASHGVPLVSLVARADELELKKKGLQEELGISREILDYLEDRRFEFTSIPGNFIERIAGILRTTTDSVAAYLNQDMRVAQVFHKNDGRPATPEKLDFVSAVKKDFNLTEEQKGHLLGH